MMNLAVWFFGGGPAFFTGLAAILIGAWLAAWKQIALRLPAATVMACLGALLIALSATPIPPALYFAAAFAFVLWQYAERSDRRTGQRPASRIGLTVCCLALLAYELPWQFVPAVTVPAGTDLYIFGDSLAAGTGEPGIETWPQILARSGIVRVHDRSRMGATVATVLKEIGGNPPGPGLILLEIGGNDVLGTTTAADFDRDLRSLLMQLSRQRQTVLMFELPLPPLNNDFGRTQRRAAAARNVHLIPRRVLAGVIAGEGATSDSIHLTAAGHRRMAKVVRQIIRIEGPAAVPRAVATAD